MATYVFGGNTVQPTYVSYKSYQDETEDLLLAWPSSFQDALDVTANIIDISTVVADLNVVMPPANQVGVGMALNINNRGAEAFNVLDNALNPIVTIAGGVLPGLSYRIYITDNSTVAGAWTFIQDGAGTSSAQAQALAGLGLIAINPVGTQTIATLNTTKEVNRINSDFIVTEEDRAQFYVAEAGVVISLVGGLPNGLYFEINNLAPSAVTVMGIVSGSFPAPTIDGLTDPTTLLTGQTATFITDGSNWFILGNLTSQVTPDKIVEVNIPSTSTSIVLTPGQTIGTDVIVFTGAPTSSLTAFMTPQDGLWAFHNDITTTSIVTIQFGSPGSPVGTAYALAQGDRHILYGNLTDDTLYSAAPHSPKVGLDEGGTGADNAVDGFDNLAPTTTMGDTIYHDGTHNVRLPIGSTGQGLVVSSMGIPAWASTAGGTVSSVAVTSSDLTVGGSPITSAGTISLSLNTVPISKGGSGQTTKSAAFNALSPSTTIGDITYFDGTNNVRLGIGTAGQGLIVAGGLPTWAAGSGGSVTSVAVSSSDLTVTGSPITSSGTISLSLNTVPISKGGSGQTTALAAFNALSPLTTSGDVLTYSGGNNIRVGAGAIGQVLTMGATLPSWSTPTVYVSSVAVNSSDLTVTGSPITTSGTINLTLNTVPTTKGGTGLTTYTSGDTLYYSAGALFNKLSIGISGQALTVVSGFPAWVTPTVYVSSVAVSSSDMTITGSPITSSGVINLSLNTISIAKGGTGQVTKTAAYNALNPNTATGDLTYFDGTNNVRLPIGTAGQQLTVAGGIPSWSLSGTGTVTSVAVTSSDLTVGGSPITSAGTITLALNTVAITKGGTGAITAVAGFNALSPAITTGDLIYFNGANNARLGVGTNGQQLTVVSGLPAWVNASTATVSSVAVSSTDLTVTGSPITTAGTINLVLNTVPISKGGTGQITAIAAFGALAPTTATGDIIYYNGTNNIKLAIGTTGQALTVASGLPSWITPTVYVSSVGISSADMTITSTPITTSGVINLSLNTVPISKGGTGQITQTTAFNALSPLTTIGDTLYYNGTNNVRLAAGTAGQALTLSGGLPAWITPTVYVSSVAVSSSDLTITGTPITTSGTISLSLNTVPTTKGGTGLTTYAVGDIPFYSSGSAFNKLAIAANQLIISSNGSAPIWSTRTSLGIAFATSLAGAPTYGITGALTGSTTISTTAVQANSLIQINPVGDTAGLLGARGYELGYGSIVPGTSFQITVTLSGSTNVTANWLIVNPITT